jgi:hypothetical protein
MDKVFKIIRRFTVPPVFATALLIIVYITHTNYFGSIWHLFGALFFLAALPTLAYPLQRFIPKYKDRGREGQRSLAMIFSFMGYLLGTLTAFIFSAPIELKIIYTEYLLCGIGMILLNKVFKIKASGHACGIVGPVIIFIYFGLYIPAIVGTALILPVYISSVRTKQHTLPQLLGGSAIPAVVLAIIVTLRFLLF